MRDSTGDTAVLVATRRGHTSVAVALRRYGKIALSDTYSAGDCGIRVSLSLRRKGYAGVTCSSYAPKCRCCC